MDLKELVSKAINRIALENNANANDIKFEMVNVIDNFMYFSVYKNNETIKNKKGNYLWKMSEIMNLNSLMLMSFSSYMKMKPKTIAEVFAKICEENDLPPKETTVEFRKTALESNNLIFSFENRNINIDYHKLNF